MKKRILYTIIFVVISFIILSYLEIIDPKVLSISDSNTSLFERLLPKLALKQRQSAFENIISEINDKSGTYALFIKNIQNDETYMFNETQYFYAASLYKTPIAVATMKEIQEGKLKYEDELTFESYDISGGTGTINNLPLGTKLTVDMVIDKLMKDSDNTGQNMLNRTVPESRIKEAFDMSEPNSTYYNTNDATVVQIGEYFENLNDSKYLNEKNYTKLLEKMTNTAFDDRIHLGLSSDIKFSHKIGNWGTSGSWHDCGIAHKYSKKIIVCIMTKGTTYMEFKDISRITGEFVRGFF